MSSSDLLSERQILTVMIKKKFIKVEDKIRYLFLNREIKLIFYMDDNNQKIKYDLRQTRFSQNYQLSIELIQKQELDCNFKSFKTSLPNVESLYIKNQLGQESGIEENGSMVCNKQPILINDDSLWRIDFSQYCDKKVQYMELGKGFECQQNWLYHKPINSLLKTQNYLIEQSTQQTTLKSQQNNSSSDSQQVFSQKLSLIRSLQQKLSSLHQKIKLPTNPMTYLEECKINLDKMYQTYTQPIGVDKNDKENSSTNESTPINELSQISHTFTQRKSLTKNQANDSIQSQSMLLDKDFQLYYNEKEIPATKIIGRSTIDKPEVQVIETIRIVEVPYLIEVDRESEEKIVSKKCFYFEENEDIHRTFEEFTQKEAKDENGFEMERSLRNEISLNESHNNDNSQKSIANHLHQKIPKPTTQNPQTSLLSLNDQSSHTFHNNLKQQRDDLSFNYDQNNHQILSKLQTNKNNHTEIQELEDKLKSLQIENSQLKEKVKQLLTEKDQMNVQRLELAEELIRLSECQEVYQSKLNKYKETLQNIHSEFAEILHFEQAKLKDYYQRQVEQFENQQSEYANRIIFFEQLFEEQKNQQQKLTQMIETQQEQIIELQKVSKQKDLQTQNQSIKRRQLQQYIIQRQKQLKLIIQNLQKDNTQLNHILHQLQLRYQSQGFYILTEQAFELKKTLQQKDLHHIEQLDKLENRYSDLIEKYQHELENMKKGLERVRLDKESSYSLGRNYTNGNRVHDHPKVNNQRLSTLRKRQSIFMSKISRPIGCSKYNNQSLTQRIQFIDDQEISIDNSQRFEKDISVSQFSQKSSLSQNQSQSSSLWLTPSELNHSQQLLLLQLENLKYQNTKLQGTLSSERAEKQKLSRKLSTINSTMGKYLDEITFTQEQQEKNQETFMKCVQELEKQFQINKKLNEKIIKLQSKKSQKPTQNNSFQTNNQSRISINEEQVKVHPIFIQLSNKYKSSKKYIKILENQLKDLVQINQKIKSI